MTERTTTEIENERVELMKERAVQDDMLQVVLEKIHALEKDITNKEIEKAEMRDAARKYRHVIRGYDLKIKLLETEFWRARGR